MIYFKPFLPKEILLDTIILLISIFVIEIGLLYWWNFVFRFQYHQILYFFAPFLYILSKFVIFFWFKMFLFSDNVLLFPIKTIFSNDSIASLLLIPLRWLAWLIWNWFLQTNLLSGNFAGRKFRESGLSRNFPDFAGN